MALHGTASAVRRRSLELGHLCLLRPPVLVAELRGLVLRRVRRGCVHARGTTKCCALSGAGGDGPEALAPVPDLAGRRRRLSITDADGTAARSSPACCGCCYCALHCLHELWQHRAGERGRDDGSDRLHPVLAALLAMVPGGLWRGRADRGANLGAVQHGFRDSPPRG